MSIFREIMPLVNSLDLKIERIMATSEVFPFLHHAICRIGGDNDEGITGRGIAFDEKTAFERAIGEALERYFYIQDGSFPNTNGIALHTSIEVARESALRELIERDSYLCHFYTRSPFYKYSDQVLNDSIFPEVFRVIQENKFNLIVGRLSSQSNLHISIAVCISGKETLEYGFSIGLGCNPSCRSSIDASIMEAVSLVPSFLQGFRPQILTKESFFKKEKVDVFDFAALAHNMSNFSDLAPLLELQERFVPSNFLPSVEFIELSTPELLKGTNVRAFKAMSHDCQELFFDNIIERNLNVTRLKRFCQNRFEISNAPMIPHYFA